MASFSPSNTTHNSTFSPPLRMIAAFDSGFFPLPLPPHLLSLVSPPPLSPPSNRFSFPLSTAIRLGFGTFSSSPIPRNSPLLVRMRTSSSGASTHRRCRYRRRIHRRCHLFPSSWRRSFRFRKERTCYRWQLLKKMEEEKKKKKKKQPTKFPPCSSVVTMAA